MTGRKNPSKYNFIDDRKEEPVKIQVYWCKEGRSRDNVSILKTEGGSRDKGSLLKAGRRNPSKCKFTDDRKEAGAGT